MFSWTNLLTRYLVPVSCFLLFFVSEKLHRNILGIARDENLGPYFPDKYTETEGETEGSHGSPTPPGGADPPGAPAHDVGPIGVPRDHPFAYLSLFVRKP